MTLSNKDWMLMAIEEALKAKSLNEVPVGAVVIQENQVIGRGHNSVIKNNSIAAHAELNAINEASKTLNNYRLLNCDLYITLEPCHMCAKAIVDARIKNVYFAALEPKTGSIISVDNFFDKSFLNHKVNYSLGLMQQESSKLLKDFFLERR